MKSLFQDEAAADVLSRIEKLTPTTQRQWGKMNVAHMMAHCSTILDVACGNRAIPRMFLGRLLGRFFLSQLTNDKPMPKNGPTAKHFLVADEKDFAREKKQLLGLVRQFHDGGEEKCTKHPHPFFGPMKAHEWGYEMYKHIDHHLKQFGV
ncbi:MAG TPA: DUF1569 domain-containing protein [Terriglobales bacterium]